MFRSKLLYEGYVKPRLQECRHHYLVKWPRYAEYMHMHMDHMLDWIIGLLGLVLE